MPSGNGEHPYLNYFGLKRAPFAPVVEDAFFFADPAISQRLDMLRHLVQYSDLLLVVMGEQGSGKTTLLQQLAGSIRDQMRVCRVDGEHGMDAERLPGRIAAGFGFSPAVDEVDALVKKLEQLPDDQPPLLLIDDAHRLDTGALVFLLKLAERDCSDGRRLRIVLFCEPSIGELLAAPAIEPLRDRISQTMAVSPLTEEQTGAYIRHRMRAAGQQTESPFSPKLVKMIHNSARGNPGRINALAHQALMEMSGEDPRRNPVTALLPESGLQWPLALVAGIVIIVAAVAILGGRDEGQPAVHAEQEAEERPLPGVSHEGDEGEETVVLLQDREHEELSLDYPVLEDGDEPYALKRESEPAQNPAPRLRGWPADTARQMDGAVVEIPAVATSPVIDEVSPSPVTPMQERQTVVLRGSGFDAGSRVTVGWTGQIKQLEAEQVEVKNPHEIRLSLVTGLMEDTWTVRVTNSAGISSNSAMFRVEPPAAKQAGLDAPVSGSNAAGSAKLFREDWFLSQNPRHYTIQLMSSGREADVVDFVQRYHLNGELAYFRGVNQGRDWYSLVSGIHSDMGSANEAAAGLSRELGGRSLWVRRIGAIQSHLRELGATPAPEKAGADTDSAPSGKGSAGWLLQQNPNHFTLQLLAGRDKATVEEFIRMHGLAGTAVYFRTVRGGKDWYAVIYNSYRSRADALAALEQLPVAWRKYRPWLRSFASIQKELVQADR